MGMIIEDNTRDPATYFWGPRTSTLDWCEENYAVNHYVAEFWNCVTNVMFLALASSGLHSAFKYRQAKRVIAYYAAMSFVGVGSLLFHATLKYETQLLDELPMLYLAALTLYSIIEIDKETKFGARVPIALAATMLGVTLVYIFWIQNPVFHQIVFALTVISTVAISCKREAEMQLSNRTKRILRRQLYTGVLGMLGGFLVWNLDNIFCQQLRTYRTRLSSPLDVLLQLHGWWHILTAYGCMSLLLWVHFLRIARLGHDNLFTIRRRFIILPCVTIATAKKVE
ncbi:alkaline ceramidase ydc1 [Coemansia interrupta]|uniref:Alkaline ceramidase ydc1 n=1 Tax=Coemansia interrupta TaxID=1126814 RepID=A0A9W8HHC8_9FUNG|nr:alkaline ceramidase ydc1 [Coemansia interrupta]